MRSVDTNVLVRAIVRDDAKQARASDVFAKAGAWISHIVLIETTWVLRSAYGRSPSEIAEAISMLLAHESFVIQDAEVVAAALTVFRGRLSIGFSDCLILETARKNGHLPLGTFDRGLSKITGTERLEAN